MSKIVTYSGKAGRYYVRDAAGKRHYFPNGEPVVVPDEVAALVPAENKDLAVAEAEAGNGDYAGGAGEAPDADATASDDAGDTTKLPPVKATAKAGTGSSEGKK